MGKTRQLLSDISTFSIEVFNNADIRIQPSVIQRVHAYHIYLVRTFGCVCVCVCVV